MRRILITGAAGFIGHAVSQRLLHDGFDILGIDNLNPYYDVRLKEGRLRLLHGQTGFTFRQLDLCDTTSILGSFSAFRPEAVIHLAAQAGVRYSLEKPKAYTEANIDGTLSILEACRSYPVGHLVYASSSSVYGTNSKVPFSEADLVNQPVSLYAATKRANELMAQTYSHLFRIPASGLRFFTVYGPIGRPDMAYYKFTDAIFAGRPIDLYNYGKMWRDFTYIGDVVEAIRRLIVSPPADIAQEGEPGRVALDVPHRIFNIGNHTPVELERFVSVLEDATGRRAKRHLLPMQAGDVERTFADIKALRLAVGFTPHTPIEDGLVAFVQWYKSYYGISE